MHTTLHSSGDSTLGTCGPAAGYADPDVDVKINVESFMFPRIYDT